MIKSKVGLPTFLFLDGIKFTRFKIVFYANYNLLRHTYIMRDQGSKKTRRENWKKEKFEWLEFQELQLLHH